MQQVRPGLWGDAFIVMTWQVYLSSGTDFWVGKSNHPIKKGACVPTWHALCCILWICLKHHRGLDTKDLALNIGWEKIHWPKKLHRDVICDFSGGATPPGTPQKNHRLHPPY